MNYYEKEVIISNDGDFYSLVDHLYKNNKLAIVLSPARTHLKNSLEMKSPRASPSFFGRSCDFPLGRSTYSSEKDRISCRKNLGKSLRPIFEMGSRYFSRLLYCGVGGIR